MSLIKAVLPRLKGLPAATLRRKLPRAGIAGAASAALGVGLAGVGAKVGGDGKGKAPRLPESLVKPAGVLAAVAGVGASLALRRKLPIGPAANAAAGRKLVGATAWGVGAAGAGIGATKFISDKDNYRSGVVRGAGMETVNAFSRAVRIPAPTGHKDSWAVYRGNAFEPDIPSEKKGADFVDGWSQTFGLRAKPEDRSASQRLRPLLGSTTVDVPRGRHAVQLDINAKAPGNNWADGARAAAMASVYVDGKHHSDITVLRERPGPYEVNLGGLSPGKHRIEVRSARDLAQPSAHSAQVKDMKTKILSGEKADVALHAPIIEGRDLGVPGGRAEAGRTDTPLMLMPYVDKHRNGSRTITYRALLSNEDGGTSWSDLYRTQGRATDWTAPIYTVELDRKGTIKNSSFEGPLHRDYKFTGERRRERPVLGFASVNNIMTQRTRGAGTVWSGAPQAINDSRHGFDLMRKNPWTFQVMGKEMYREAKLHKSPIKWRAVDDPRRYLYFNGDSPLRRELNAGKKVQLELRDGRLVNYSYDSEKHSGRSTAVVLPDNIKAEDVVGFRGHAGEVHALGRDFYPRVLQSTKPRNDGSRSAE